MKLLCLLGTIVIAVATVHGAADPSWLMIPDEEGNTHLAVLRGNYEAREIDPYNDITFHLYTRSNPDDATQIYVGDLGESFYDPTKPTRFIVHGYNSNAFTGGNVRMRQAFLRAEDCNVVGVDWSGPGGGVLYNVCRANAKPTGDYIGEFYSFLVSVGAAMSDLHCVGHSLGAHVCGFSGKAVNGSIGRITGLDPALPLFDIEVPEERLANTDALYVDVIHTCGGYLGLHNATGHADFYPNDGTMIQPGCGADVSGSCSHGRCWDYFVESIESSAFVSHKCDSWSDFQNGLCFTNEEAVMGFPSPSSTRGSFFLATAGESPFALG